MSNLGAAWRKSLDDIKREVTGRTLWQALDAVVPIIMEEDRAVFGVPAMQSTVIGHLKATPVMRVIQAKMNAAMGREIVIEIIAGTEISDWENFKAREEHVQKLQHQATTKAAETRLKEKQWDDVYERLSRMYAGIPNKGLPQNRARFLRDGVKLVAEIVAEAGKLDEVGERALARLIDRIAGYTDVSGTQIALLVLEHIERLRQD